MPARVIMPDKNPPKADRGRRLKSPKLIVTLVLAIILIAAAAIYFFQHKSLRHVISKSSNSAPITAPSKSTSYSVSYSKLNPYTLKAISAGTGATFVQPDEFQAIGGTSTGEQVLLVHLPKIRAVPDYGRIALAAVKTSSASASAQASGFAGSVSDPKGQGYTATLSSLTIFINPRLPIKYQATISSAPTAFTNPNITAGAWVADFTAANPGSSWPTLQGKIIIVFGENAVYYFMAENISSIWQSNQSTWQTVLNSLKVDQ